MQISQIEQLNIFKIRDKFSNESWNERGLNPPNPETCQKLTSLFNDCSQSLIEAIHKRNKKSQMKSILQSHLHRFIASEYDTEEREFICDLFYELSKILQIEFKNEVSRWLYGKRITIWNKVFKNDEQIIDVISQRCHSCQTMLESFVMEKEDSIPEMDWMIVQCNNCREYNLLDIGPNVKQLKFGNYKMIESLPKTKYTADQAGVRLEQIRAFRHN